MFHKTAVYRLKDILFLSSLLLVLAACGGEEPTPTMVAVVPTSTPTAIPPTATPAPTATPTPTFIPTPVVSDPVVSVPEPVKPGEEVGISVRVDGVAGIEITYEWTVDKGEILSGQGTSSITYKAPVESGLCTIKVTITAAGAKIERSKFINVAKPADTPTSIKEPAVTIAVTEPKKEVECLEGAACTFTIKGTSTGVAGSSDYKIVPFVNPGPGDPNQWFPQWDRPLGSQISEDGTWQAEAQIGTDEGVEPGHHFEIVALVMDASAEIPVEFQSLPSAIAKSSIVNLTTIAVAEPSECPFVPPFRIPIEGPAVDVQVSITSMENCTDNLPTASSIPLRGTYSGDMTNREIWILVYPPDVRYYPQSTDACRDLSTQFASGQWAEIIRLGRPGVPEPFHVVAVVTDVGSPASEAFHNYLRVGCDTGNFNGFMSLPAGVTELDAITVHTR
jgi:hypothetical protein